MIIKSGIVGSIHSGRCGSIELDCAPDTSMRRVDIPKVNIDVSVYHNITIKKWYYYQDNIQAHQHTFFVVNYLLIKDFNYDTQVL